jgi:hypothetical protein
MMANPISEVLSLKPNEKRSLGKFLGKIKDIDEFLADTFEGLKSVDFLQAMGDALPWAGAFTEALGEAIPPVKFLVKLFSKLTEEKDPNALAYLACTLSYLRAVEQATRTQGPPKGPRRSLPAKVKKDLSGDEAAAQLDFERFSFGNALEHPFIRRADTLLEGYLEAAGYDEAQQRALIGDVHQRFVPILKNVLSHGDTRERFLPLLERMRLGAREKVAFEALIEHAEYQRWLFEEKPVFGKEPFNLAQVYIDTECGKLTWEEIRDGGPQGPMGTTGSKEKERVDPFLEKFGGRHPLGKTVLGLLGDPNFRDAIVVQGPAGAGKSAFTLWLCAELVRQGLRPVRVLLRDLRLDRTRPIAEALAQAVRLTEEAYLPEGVPYPRPEDLFGDGQIFRERIRFGQAVICPYVLILDGWDEISISVSEGFRVRLDRMLENLRTEFLQLRDVPVRVILTGRPSTAVTESSFLLRKTPILTVRPLNPSQLREFVERLSVRVNAPTLVLQGAHWKPFKTERFLPVFQRYEKDFSRLAQGQPSASGSGQLEVLGLPLLAHLAVRLLAEPSADMGNLVANPTALYRGLVDLTCAKSGKSVEAEDETDQQFRIAGGRLRDLLRRTAAAITVYGRENISYSELRLRLDLRGADLEKRVQEETGDSELSQLMISYYFKGGHSELGCEFLHKSFREYLFAEGVVEILKSYGRKVRETLPERTPYWKEFEGADPRFVLSRDLAALLAPRWLSSEVRAHLEELIRWETERNRSGLQPAGPGQATEPLDIAEWERVRDGLADLWDWWGEGVHLRPQPVHTQRRDVGFEKTYAQVLVEWMMPLDLERGAPPPEPPRLVVADADLGDALFTLVSQVHLWVAVQKGWGEGSGTAAIWEAWNEDRQRPRRCQALVEHAGRRWTLFSPSGERPTYFCNYRSRINGSGWRPSGDFPLGVALRGMDLSGVDLSGANLSQVDLGVTNLSGAHLSGAYLYGANLNEANLDTAQLIETNLSKAFLRATDLSRASLRGANLREADLGGANFFGAILGDADLRGANLIGANLREAVLPGAKREGALFDKPWAEAFSEEKHEQ